MGDQPPSFLNKGVYYPIWSLRNGELTIEFCPVASEIASKADPLLIRLLIMLADDSVLKKDDRVVIR